MLALGRKLGDVTYLDVPGVGRIAVTVLLIDRDRVRLGFEAPKEVKIMREELVRRAAAEAAR